jgi:putative DNA primase/helicase
MRRKSMPKDKIRIPHNLIAGMVMSKESLRTMMDTDALLRYDGKSGLYLPDGEAFVKAKVEKIMAENDQSEFTTISYVREVIGHIKRSTYIERDLINGDSDLLVVQNGIIRLTDRELLPHSPRAVFTIGIPVTYLPSAKCPGIDLFFHQIVKPSDVALLCELCGWCLDRKSTIQKLFFLLGGGAAGKSTFLNLLRKFLGPENCSAASLQSLADNRFTMAQLADKLANIFPDLPASGIKDAAIIKGLTGGDVMQAEHKFERPFNLQNTAKLVFSANKAPRLSEDTDAIWRRLVIVGFPNQFIGNKADSDLIDKLTVAEELSGLLNAALDALQRLRHRKAFTVSASMAAIRREYLLSSNPVPVFIEERCVRDLKASVTKDELYEAFLQFCDETEANVIGKKAFGVRLNAMAVASEGQDAWYTHVWRGLKLRE